MRDAVRGLELRLKEDDIKRDQPRTQLKAGLDALDRGAFSKVDDTALDSLVDRQLNPDSCRMS